jgi:hypothetical protein
MERMRTTRRAIRAVAMMLFLASGVFAQYFYTPTAGINLWTDQSKWSPSYPGTSVAPGNAVVINDGGTVIINAVVNISSGLRNDIASPGNALLIGTGVNAGSLSINVNKSFRNNVTFDTQGSPFTVNGIFTNLGIARVLGMRISGHTGIPLQNSGTLFLGNSTISIDNYSFSYAPGRLDLETSSSSINGGDAEGSNGGPSTFAVGYNRPSSGTPAVGSLTVSGRVRGLSGTFEFYLWPGSDLPAAGEQYTVLSSTALTGRFANNSVQIAPGLFANIYYTASTAYVRIESFSVGVTVAGRLLQPDGRGVRRATLTIKDANGVPIRQVQVGRNGAFAFTDIHPGESYTITAAAGRFALDPVTISVNGAISDLTLTAHPAAAAPDDINVTPKLGALNFELSGAASREVW